jgi:endoglucanase Acf2
VLPSLPNAPEATDRLNEELDNFYTTLIQKATPFKHKDTYWNGKELGKISEAVFIADQLGKIKIRDSLVKVLQRRIEDWADARHELFFYYDKTWSTLVGYPDSYGSGEQLNDHHFHYSYFIRAAATIARFDADWVKPENYGGFIDLLIRTCANYDRDDKRFCWMRNFDPYAGHSWAAGHAGFASGNNQESSSESMNFATSLILYGEATGDTSIRDLGIYWHATEAEAIRNYWFDLDSEVFPDGFGHSCVGMVWSDGGAYGTWWTANPEEIHGINHLPVNGGSLYLGRDPDYVVKNFENMLRSNRNFHKAGFPGDPDSIDRWQDILCEAAYTPMARLAPSPWPCRLLDHRGSPDDRRIQQKRQKDLRHRQHRKVTGHRALQRRQDAHLPPGSAYVLIHRISDRPCLLSLSDRPDTTFLPYDDFDR